VNGVVWYNTGWKCLVRLAASMDSFRDFYPGLQAALIMDGDSGCVEAQEICDAYAVEYIHTEFKTPPGSKRALINKTLMAEKTPFDCTVFLDADTIVVGGFSELWEWAATGDFVVPQFHDWKTKGKIRKRIQSWSTLYPDMMELAIADGEFPAINCGVYAWADGNELMLDWYKYAEPGRDLQRIPDETCLQVILHRYPHFVAPHWFNVSCKYDNAHSPLARIIHYHGNKHCRFVDGQPVNQCELWYPHFERALEKIDCLDGLVRKDRMLRKYHKEWMRYAERQA